MAYDHTWSSPSLPRAYPFVPVHGEGATVTDIDGNVFVDFCAGIAVNSTGHSHPAVIRAITNQRLDVRLGELEINCKIIRQCTSGFNRRQRLARPIRFS